LQKKKVLILSDHALSTSGVATQTRHLVNGLLKKGGWTFRQFGAALKHASYETVVVNEDFIIKPIDGFGDRNLLRSALINEKPDAILIFTDPRFFTWLFEMEDEIHQICPIAWWHVWDNYPAPEFNRSMYEATDLINCHSYLTYEICKSMFPNKTNFIPHAVPTEIFKQLSKNEISTWKAQLFGQNKKDNFVAFWNNRNARRKRPADVLESWKIFLDLLQEKHGHKNATLLMHTDPFDQEGPNLQEVVRMLGIGQNVTFSSERIDFEKMNILYNISDVTINISFAEGFGLSTLEAMTIGKPIIALKTGGLTRQVVDHRDGSENGVALPVELRTIVGSQSVPYIYEDYVSSETTGKAIMQIYELGPEGREKLGQKAKDYVNSEFSIQSTVDAWDKTLTDVINNWREKRKSWSVEEV
jgi:glycosyltransferase involved in cell wall biosynthesis